MLSDARKKWARIAVTSAAVATSLLLSSCATTRLRVEPRMGKDPKAIKASYIELNNVISKEQAKLIHDYANGMASPPISMGGVVELPDGMKSLRSYSDLSIERVEGDDSPPWDGPPPIKFEDYKTGGYELKLPKGKKADLIRLKLKPAVYYKDTDAIIQQLEMMLPQKQTLYFKAPEKKKDVETGFINEILCIVFL